MAMIKEAKIVSLVPLFPMPQYVVVLEDIEKSRLVPIWIGVHEGNAISLVLQGEKYPRPLTHDLFVNTLKLTNLKIEKIVVSDIKEGSYFAIICLNQNGKILEIDAMGKIYSENIVDSPRQGEDLITTIDSKIQTERTDELKLN